MQSMARKGSSGARRNSAFTLIELLLVAVVLGMAAGLAAPRLSALLPRLRLQDGGRHVIDAVRTAQTWATDRGSDVVIEYDLVAREVRLVAAGAPAEDMPRLPALPEGVRLSGVRLAADSRVTEGVATVRVHAGGYVRPHQVELFEPKAGRLLVDVHGAMARIRRD